MPAPVARIRKRRREMFAERFMEKSAGIKPALYFLHTRLNVTSD
jgi:hypothetical protein